MILLVGATGDLGGRIARRLRESGQDVRCLVRSTTDASGLLAIGAEVVHGDLTERDTLLPACQGAATVIATATAISRRLQGQSTASIHDVDEVGMGHLIEAAEAAGVSRFVYLSFTGVATAVETPLQHAKLAIERRLAASAMQTVIVRSDAFQEVHFSPLSRFDMGAGKVSVIGKGDTKARWVAEDDVAALLCAVAIEPEPPRLVEFGGPESLTKNEASAVAGKLMHRRMKVRHMPRPVARLAVRLLSGRNDGLASALGAGLTSDLNVATWDDMPLRQRGINPKPVTDFLEEQARAMARPAR
ncbi:SDR family oxidoreductase [Pseudarthrobacter defluvii]|uniref:SDR family oxidoreductase n=1 Tax=Pseudarthrobacter defluvii TaxID=410837 RepID=UPI0025770D24|nr:NAD(P)H-binding protein [Pseudarthrobacter defluvii]WJH23544.1 NmrA family NAD(P)-binding protein [Pseudarthrobacter defluvii]